VGAPLIEVGALKLRYRRAIHMTNGFSWFRV